MKKFLLASLIAASPALAQQPTQPVHTFALTDAQLTQVLNALGEQRIRDAVDAYSSIMGQLQAERARRATPAPQTTPQGGG
jgi:hypothetical protein